jgi:hypothetical protein
VEHTCHRCGAGLSEGAAFCNQCGAPQVRVPETFTAPATSENAGESSLSRGLTSSASGTIHWGQARKAAAVAALLMAFGALIPPLNMVLPLWMLVGGWICVSLYRRRTAVVLVPAATGAKLGALAGIIGFAYVAVLASIVFAVEVFGLKNGEQLRSVMKAQLEQAAASNPSGAQLTQLLQTPEGMTTLIISVVFVMFLLFLLLSCAGGIFGAAFGRQRMR